MRHAEGVWLTFKMLIVNTMFGSSLKFVAAKRLLKIALTMVGGRAKNHPLAALVLMTEVAKKINRVARKQKEEALTDTGYDEYMRVDVIEGQELACVTVEGREDKDEMENNSAKEGDGDWVCVDDQEVNSTN